MQNYENDTTTTSLLRLISPLKPVKMRIVGERLKVFFFLHTHNQCKTKLISKTKINPHNNIHAILLEQHKAY